MDIFFLFFVFLLATTTAAGAETFSPPLRFNKDGQFKILQVADMHYVSGKSTWCRDVPVDQWSYCSDLNTTAFINRLILAENPDFLVFTGDNIFGPLSLDPEASLNGAFSPAVESSLPWAAVLGNHDHQLWYSRETAMKHMVQMKGTLSKLNPEEAPLIDGFGNYNLEVGGPEGSSVENKSVLNLYFLDSGDSSTLPGVSGYDWIKLSQQYWFKQTSLTLKNAYTSEPGGETSSAPGLAYFHIPLPEFASFDGSDSTGVKQEGISSATINSGFFTTMLEAGDVKAAFVGHDHINDFCGELHGINLCYAGGTGYQAYGKVGWPRRARVVLATLEETENKGWGPVKSIRTWKRLDDAQLSTIDSQDLWTKVSSAISST